MDLFNQTSFKTSKLITVNYSTSFSYATSLMNKNHREAIYSIYGFVRFADEIVDSFHNWDKSILLEKFEKDLNLALEHGISLNPVLNSFQLTVKKYRIPVEYIQAFMNSMKLDLEKKQYNTKLESGEYIYGSADVVGLMCLRVFCDGNDEKFENLKVPAMKLGSAFQKVNFLRDLKNDRENLGRNYFPQLNDKSFDKSTKKQIIEDIKADFDVAYEGIKLLPADTKMAVLLAFYYYRQLLNKIEMTKPEKILETRIRISNFSKIALMLRVKTLCKLKLV